MVKKIHKVNKVINHSIKHKQSANHPLKSYRTSKDLERVTKLGEKITPEFNYAPEILEAFTNKHPNRDAWTSLICTEFTTLCPKTGQPDFAKIFINYIADKSMVESKSLKLYLTSFRQHGHFHEDLIQIICNDLSSLLLPRYLEVVGVFTPRGGISIFPYCNYSNNQEQYKELKNKRLFEYIPGKYSMDLSLLY
ncbi:MAG: preQ(1) synthase [Oligoflexia bacterium]|nr:preQ(1) synthase [Oligoflexia bacterium]